VIRVDLFGRIDYVTLIATTTAVFVWRFSLARHGSYVCATLLPIRAHAVLTEQQENAAIPCFT
jgi:hypothetical protein